MPNNDNELLDQIKSTLNEWTYKTPIPTLDTRCIGFILEASIYEHLQKKLPQYNYRSGAAIEYPDIEIVDQYNNKYALEIKAAPKQKGIGNRVKSPESIVKFYGSFKEHWILLIFYKFTENNVHITDITLYFLHLWEYASTTFKDMSALGALTSLDILLRNRRTNTQFRNEKEFIEFTKYMSTQQGTTAQRNKIAKEWLKKSRQSNNQHLII